MSPLLIVFLILFSFLSPTEIIDSNHPEVRAFAEKARGDAEDPADKAVRLYYAVRDGIWYDPYYPFFLPEHYRASNVLRGGRGFCIPKALFSVRPAEPAESPPDPDSRMSGITLRPASCWTFWERIFSPFMLSLSSSSRGSG